MSSDFLTIAKSKEEDLSGALAESVEGVTAVAVGTASAEAVEAIAASFAAHATSASLECLLLISPENIEALSSDSSGGPAEPLQSISSTIFAALSDDASAEPSEIQISSPGEWDQNVISGCELVKLTVTASDSEYDLIVAVVREGSTGATGLPLPELDASGAPTLAAGEGLGLLADVEVDVTVELGRRRLPINELLTLTRGSIIELAKLVGEPLEVYVNNRLIADGEAVVIDEQFGIRISNIIPSAQRTLGT